MLFAGWNYSIVATWYGLLINLLLLAIVIKIVGR